MIDPPLVPTPDEARAPVRRELLDPEYHDQQVLQRILGTIGRWLDGVLDAASSAPPLSAAAAIVIAVLGLIALGLLLSRLRATPRAATARPVLADEVVSAAELRARARSAFAQERYAATVIDGFRAVAVGQVERGRLDDRPGATAHEVALVLAADHPVLREQVVGCADAFDLVRYGDRPATREQALAVLALDDALVGTR